MRKLTESPQHILSAVTSMIRSGESNDDVLLALIALSYLVRTWDRSLVDTKVVVKMFRDPADQTMHQMQKLISSGDIHDVESALRRLKRDPVAVKDMLFITTKKLNAVYDELGLNDTVLPR